MASTQLPVARPLPAWRARLAAFWRWWSGELKNVAYERFAALRGAGEVPSVALERDELVLLAPRSLAGPDARIDLAGQDPIRARAALQSLLGRAGEMRGRIRLCLGPGEALLRRVTMPLATEENLPQVLSFEMDRLTPFTAGDVYFDYRVLSRDAAAGQLVLQLAVARREVVDASVERLRSIGANVQGVGVRDAPGAEAAALDLLPSEQRGERESARERLLQRALVAAVVILLALALLIPVWRKRETVIALLPLVAKAQQEAQEADRVARELDRQVDEYNFLLAKKHSNYPVLAYVEEISRLLPDSTWLQQLQVKSNGKIRQVELTGETPSSSKLIEILTQSKLLRNPTPRGTSTRGSTPNSERFLIEAEAPLRPLPDAVPVLSAPAPIAAKPPAAPSPAAPAQSAKGPSGAAVPAPVPAPAPGFTPAPRTRGPQVPGPPPAKPTSSGNRK